MIARKSALIIAIQIANGILGFIGLKFIAMYMERWEYGVVGFAYGFVAVFAIFGRLGFDEAHVKRVSEGKDLRKCIDTFATVKLFLVGLMAILLFSFIAVWKYIMHRGFETPSHEKAVYIMLAYFILLTLSQIFTSTFTARKEIAKSRLPYFVYTLVRVIATIYVAVNGYGALALAYTYLIGEIFHFALALIFFRGYPTDKPSLEYFNDYAVFAVHMAVASVPWLVMSNVDKVFIQLFWNAEEVGGYFAIFNLSRFIIVFATAVGTLLMPTISEFHVRNKIEEIRRLTLQSERYLSMIIFILVLSMIALAKPIIHILLSDKYMPALPILQILPFFVLLDVLARPYLSQLQGMNMPEYTRNRILMMIFINVALNLILIPKDIKSLGLKLYGLGAMGAAMATVISYAVGYIYIRIVAWRKTGTKGSYSIVLHAIAAAIVADLLYIISKVYFIGRWYQLLLIAIFGLALYFALLALMGEFTKKDYDLFMDTLNIKKMLQYIKEEIKEK